MKCKYFAGAACLFAGLSSFPLMALAVPTNISTGGISIGSNGSQYVIKDFGALSAIANVNIATDHRIEDWWVTLWLGTEEDGWTHYPESKSPNHHYKWINNIKSVSKKVSLEIPTLSFGTYVVARCNAMANQLRQADHSDQEIFNVDRSVEIFINDDAKAAEYGQLVQAAFAPGQIWANFVKFTVPCGKWPGAAVQTGAKNLSPAAPVVLGSWLFAEETSLPNGYCKIKLNGSFKASQPGLEVEFHYEDNTGLKSNKNTESADANANAVFSHEYGVPYNAAGPVSGWIKIVGDSHEFESQPIIYEMDCAKAGTGQTQFGLVQPPKIKVDYVDLENFILLADKRVCPRKATVYGVVSTHGTPFDGKATLQVKMHEQNQYSSVQNLHIGATGLWPVVHTLDLDWSSQGPSGGTFASTNSVGPTSMTLYGKVKLYNADMEPILPVMALSPLLIKCRNNFTGMQVTTPQVLQNNQVVTSSAMSKKPMQRAGTSKKLGSRAGAKIAVIALPDLIVKFASNAGQGIWRIKVANIGQGKAAATTIQLSMRGKKSVSSKVGPLNKGQEVWITVKSVAEMSAPVIMVDPKRQILETNDNNNRLKIR